MHGRASGRQTTSQPPTSTTTAHEAIESVLCQNNAPMEVIEVDDGSTDDTVAGLKSIADPRLRILHRLGNSGPSQAHNHGIKNYVASSIAFQDSDDVWLAGKLLRK